VKVFPDIIGAKAPNAGVKLRSASWQEASGSEVMDALNRGKQIGANTGKNS